MQSHSFISTWRSVLWILSHLASQYKIHFMLRRMYLLIFCLFGIGALNHAQDKSSIPPPPPPSKPVHKKQPPPPPKVVTGDEAIPIVVTSNKKAKKMPPPPPPPVKTSPGRPHGVPKAPPPPPVKGKVVTPEKPVSQQE